MTNFHLLEVVGRGSETQLQIAENLNGLRDHSLAVSSSPMPWMDVFALPENESDPDPKVRKMSITF